MGKSQYKKKTRRHNPIRVPDAHLGSGVAAAAKVAKEEDVLPVLKKLNSADPSDRSWALSAITNLTASNPALRRLFLAHALISLLIDRLTDPVENVIVEATGCLRNLMIDGGHEVGGEFVNKGGLVALAAMVPRVSATISQVLGGKRPEGEVEAASFRLVFPLAENIMSIFWSLSETSNKTLQALNSLDLTPFLMAFIERRQELPRGVAVAAAQCLYALSSDNPPVQKALATSNSDVSTLLSVLESPYSASATAGIVGKAKAAAGADAMDEDHPSEKAQRAALRTAANAERAKLLQVLVAGTLKNLQIGDGKRRFKALQNQLEGLDGHAEGLLNDVLDQDLQEAVREVQENVAVNNTAPTPSDALRTDHKTIPEIRLESVERRLSSVMIALEVMTSICASATFADANDGDDDNMDAQAEVMQDQDVDVDVDGSEDDEALIAQGRNPDELYAVLAANEQARLTNESFAASATAQIPASNRHARIARLSRPTALSFPPAPDGQGFIAPSLYPPATALLGAVHLRSLEALNNLLLTNALLAPAPTPPLAGQAAPLESEVQQWNDLIGKRLPGLQGLWDESFDWAKVFAPDPSVLHAAGQEARAECLEALCGVWWGLAKIGALGALTVSADQLQILADVYGVVGSAEAKVRLVGAMSVLAIRPQVSGAENQAIGSFLIGLVQSLSIGAPLNPDVVVAALNGIFDVYADERATFDRPVFMDGGFLPVLAGSVSKVKSMAKGIDKRKEPELRAQAEEAYENLLAFIKYRRSVR